jgi:hypothetical protein
LKTSDEKTAIVYYRTPSLSARLELLDELVRATLPRKLRKSGGHDLPIVKSWKDIYGEAKNLLGTRRRIAHHPVADRFIFGAPDGTGILGSKTSLEIYESNAVADGG